ncbi:undecaprenyl-diphosphatase [Pseudonocardia hierapolitana]|uniref:Undecaprenyl-diphosphatase n=1 Tax=Pseudonocardia hierapolitana TaxID=1128676 RepID=A0A561SPH0_9PSEU|nr:phosphatase PAP2 family protein [Pseudonocardia hierapolitana]TWF76768.1 undecaprenyl-diphosphatase [Pseudonocardia hierapolitana]
MIVADISDVPDVSAEWYRRIVDAAAELPAPLQAAAAFATEAVLAVYVAAFALLWWRARTRTAPVVARALAAPVVTVLAYTLSETAKEWKAVDRPCRLLAVPTIAPCPEVGDWSFPSNHAAVAGAVAVAVLWSALRLGAAVLVLAAAAAASRMVVGVHFPHDVVAGFLLGAVVAAALPTIARMGETTVLRLRSRPVGRLALGSGPVEAPTQPLPVR